MSWWVLQNIQCCIAYHNNGSSIKWSQNDFEHYKIAFTDILVSSYHLKLEPKPIGEGKWWKLYTDCALWSCNVIIGAFGVVYGATFQKGWDHEAVAVKTVKGVSLKECTCKLTLALFHVCVSSAVELDTSYSICIIKTHVYCTEKFWSIQYFVVYILIIRLQSWMKGIYKYRLIEAICSHLIWLEMVGWRKYVMLWLRKQVWPCRKRYYLSKWKCWPLSMHFCVYNTAWEH